MTKPKESIYHNTCVTHSYWTEIWKTMCCSVNRRATINYKIFTIFETPFRNHTLKDDT